MELVKQEQQSDLEEVFGQNLRYLDTPITRLILHYEDCTMAKKEYL